MSCDQEIRASRGTGCVHLCSGFLRSFLGSLCFAWNWNTFLFIEKHNTSQSSFATLGQDSDKQPCRYQQVRFDICAWAGSQYPISTIRNKPKKHAATHSLFLEYCLSFTVSDRCYQPADGTIFPHGWVQTGGITHIYNKICEVNVFVYIGHKPTSLTFFT